MYLTASAVNKAFYSNEPHARYFSAGGKQEHMQDSVLHLNGGERRIMTDALVEHRSRLLYETSATEQLLRRVAGSITEFVNEVGARPLQISDYDMAVLAIEDGNLAAFHDVCRNLPNKTGDILNHTAGRPGRVGFEMTSSILAQAKELSNESYLTACKNAIATGDTERVLMMALKAEDCVSGLDMGLYGKMIGTAISEKQRHIAHELVKQCTSDQIKAAHPSVLTATIYSDDTQLAFKLAEKGIDATEDANNIIQALKYKDNDWMLTHLFARGMTIDTELKQYWEDNIKQTQGGQTMG
jgi:hypothetical protein